MTTGHEFDEATSVALPWREWGAADAPRTALLLHGISSAGGVWWRVADLLAAQGFRVVAPDLRGHGDAPRTLRYPLGALAGDVLRLHPGRGGDGGDPWDVVVAHSLGGAVAVLALAHDPGWARSAVLVDPAVRTLRADNPVAFDAFVAASIAEVEHPDAAAIQAAHPDWHPEDVHLKVRAARQASRHTIEGILSDTGGWDVVSQFERITTPVTVLGADPSAPDASVSAALGAHLADAHGNVRYTVATGSGHSIHRSDPDRVVAEAVELVLNATV